MKIFFALFLVSFAQASENPTPQFESCSEQIKIFCENEKAPAEIIKCLRQNESKLSDSCKQEILRIAKAVEQVKQQGSGSLSVLGGMSSQNPPFPLATYEGRHTPGDDSMNEARLNLSSPIYGSKEEYLAASLALAQVQLGRSYLLNSGIKTPTTLYRAEIGTQYVHQLPERKNWGVRGSIGYAGDKIFEKLKDTTFSVNFTYGYPTSPNSFLNWAIFISNNSPLGNYIPIPGFMYIYRTETFTGIFGFPILSLQWTPIPDWAYSFSALGPAMTAEAAYGKIQELQYFLSTQWNNQNFILSERNDDKDRLTLEEKKLGVGVRTFAFERMKLEIQAGHSFDRIIYSGEGLRNMKDGSADLKSEWYLFWSVKSAFF